MGLNGARGAVASVLLVGVVSGCGAAPSGPSSGPSDLGSLTVEGPTSLAVGDVAAFRVTQRTGGQTRDVTDTARWTISPPFLTITGGTGTAIGVGSASIKADLDGMGSASLNVQIVGRIDGTYTMFIGGGVCKWGNLPPQFRNRTFQTTLVQRGTGLDLQLADAAFEGHAPGTAPVIRGRYEGGTDPVVFDLPPAARGWWNENEIVWSPVTEVLPDGSRIEIYGTVRATPVASGLSGTFKGFFYYSASATALFRASQDCESDTHQFTLTR